MSKRVKPKPSIPRPIYNLNPHRRGRAVNFAVRVPDGEREALDALARERGTNRAALVRGLIRQELSRETVKPT